MDRKTTASWALGANNIAARDRLPEGHYRQAVNLDPTVGGKLELRCGFERVAECQAGRGAFAVGGHVVFADGDQLQAFDVDSGGLFALGTISAAGSLAGAELNGQLYLSTQEDSLRLERGQLKPWAIAAPAFDLQVVAGNLPAGLYRVAVTAVGGDGEESGCIPEIVRLDGAQALRVTSADPRSLKLYASPVNSETLYSQGRLYGPTAITGVADDTETLLTAHLVPMPHCDQMVAYRGVLIGRVGRHVYITEPYRPHLVDPLRGFFQYGSDVTMLAATDGGVYIAADKTWFLIDPQTETPSQRVVLDVGAVAGAALTLPDGRAAWFTRYGQAIGDSAGGVLLPNRDKYAPSVAAAGAAGLLEHNGNQMVVTTMRGQTKENRLAAGDFCEVEITDER